MHETPMDSYSSEDEVALAQSWPALTPHSTAINTFPQIDIIPASFYPTQSDSTDQHLVYHRPPDTFSTESPIPSTCRDLILWTPEKTFPRFAGFPLELQIMVFEFSIEPRLVHWRPGGGKAPAVMRTCQSSRRAGKNVYCKIEVRDRDMDGSSNNGNTYTLMINFAIDIVYRSPELLRQLEDLARIVGPWSVTAHEATVANQIAPPDISVWFIHANITNHVKRFSVELRTASRLLGSTYFLRFYWPPDEEEYLHEYHLTYWKSFRCLFPALEEFIVTLYPEWRMCNSYGDIQEVREVFTGEERPENQMLAMNATRRCFQAHLFEGGRPMPVRLTFMRLDEERDEKLLDL